jgi:hypothetical protein
LSVNPPEEKFLSGFGSSADVACLAGLQMTFTTRERLIGEVQTRAGVKGLRACGQTGRDCSAMIAHRKTLFAPCPFI